MTDRDQIKPICGRQLNRREPCDEANFRKVFAKIAIEQRLYFLLPRVKTLQDLLEQAKELGLTIQLKQKNVTFTLTENNQTISLEHQQVSKKTLYDVSFFQDYFSEWVEADIELSDNIKEDFEVFLTEQAEKLSTVESIASDYQIFSENRKAVHEFEVELAPHQVDRAVEDGIFIKISFGVKTEGLIFIPNYQLDEIEHEEEKKFKVYIRETSSYFIYHKESSDKNRYMKGRYLIRQLTQDSKNLPYRRRVNLKELHESERRRLARYEFSKLNLIEGITLEQIEREILENQDQLSRLFDNYEEAVRKLESFVEVLNRTGIRPRETHDKELD